MVKKEGKTTVLKFNLNSFRTEGITDRDAAGLYGKDPDRSKTRIWEDKIDLVDSTLTPELDPHPDGENAFQMAKKRFERAFNPGMTFSRAYVQNPGMPFMRAEIDGMVIGVGQKTLGFKNTKLGAMLRLVKLLETDYQMLGREGFKFKGIPEKHWIEIQHTFAVTQAQYPIHFVATIDGHQFRCVKIERDDPFISNHLAECILFWDYVRRAALPLGVDPGELEFEPGGDFHFDPKAFKEGETP